MKGISQNSSGVLKNDHAEAAQVREGPVAACSVQLVIGNKGTRVNRLMPHPV